MKEFLTRKVFGGKVPVWVVILVVGGAAFLYMRKRKGKAAQDDSTPTEAGASPFGYSAPDMFPSNSGWQGYGGPASAPATQVSGGTGSGLSAHQLHVLHEEHVQHVANTPAYNQRLSPGGLSPHQLHVLHEQHLQHIGR